MNLATWSIRNPVPSVLLFIILSLAGVWGFVALPVQSLPDLDLPTMIVTLNAPGAAPAQLETEVARKVEDSVATLSGVRHVRTSIVDGIVSMRVEFELEKPLSEAALDTKNAVDRVRSDLPTSVLPPSVTTAVFGSDPALTVAVSAPRMNEEALSWYIDDVVAKAVLGVPGVDRFERLGGVRREIRVDIDPVRLASLGATITDVSRALRQMQQEASGGLARLGGTEQAFRTTALVAQAGDLAGLRVILAGGRQLRLDQIATIHDGIAERSQTALLDGKPAVGFDVYRARGFDETRVAAAVQAALDRLGSERATFAVVGGSVDYTIQQYRGSIDMLLEGAVLAVLIVFLFLRDWRATLIAATALPLSILPAFAAMHWLGYSLNTITLLALAVIVGILVDDAIVEIENIERHMQMGKPIRKATEDAVSEIALAVTATTLSLVAVFLPTAMMPGLAGMLFQQFGWTAVFAVLASLLVARLLTPVMAIYFLRPRPSRHVADGWLMTRYIVSIRWCLSHRRTTIALAAAFTAASIALLPLIPTGFIPAADEGVSTVTVELPPGSTMPMTLKVAEAARRSLAGVDGIARVFTVVGSPGDDADVGDVRRASLTLTLAERGARADQQAIEAVVRTRLAGVPGARFALSSGGPGQKLELVLASDDQRALQIHALALERGLRGIGTLANIASTASLERPEIVIRPDAQRAAEQGITTAAIGEFVRISTSGDYDADVARLNLDNRQVYIRVRVPDAARTDLATLGGMRIAGNHGLVPLSSVAALSVGSGPSAIDRYDRERYVTITADLGDMALGDALAAAMALPAVRGLPTHVKLIEVGDSELAAELATGFGVALGVGVALIFCVLTLLFKDFFQPVTILSAIPLSAGGAFVALLVAGSELDIPAMIGLVMLTGIVTKNSILLVEYAVLGIDERGLAMHDALVDACHKRARPIVMTTIAMIAGMTPIALGLGADASFRQPMAIAVIGGLVTSTALSLLVVPVVFTYIAKFEAWLRGLLPGPALEAPLEA